MLYREYKDGEKFASSVFVLPYVWYYTYVMNKRSKVATEKADSITGSLKGELNLEQKWQSDDLFYINNERNLPSF